MKKHEVAILEAGLTPNFLVKQYDLAHKLELGRMTCDLAENNFSPKQATAFLEPLLISIVHDTMNHYLEPLRGSSGSSGPNSR